MLKSVTFSSKSLVPQAWNASGDTAWMTTSPASGAIAHEQDQIVVQANAAGMVADNYNGIIRIAITDKKRPQITAVPVKLVVTGGTATDTARILLNPTSLNFSGVAGGPPPLAKPITLSNRPAGH